MPITEKNLLLGVIALQVDFIDRDAMVDAMQRWVQHKDRSVVEILVDQGKLSDRQAELLENLAREHVARVGGTEAEGLAALSSIGTVRSMLEEIDDTDVNRTLASFAPQNLETVAPASKALPFAVDQHDPSRRRFRILRTHAKGGLGQVYLAEDDELHRNVALKEIIGRFADVPANRERFVVEAEITGRLQHPGIVPVYGLGTYPDGRPFYAMRFVEGDNLLTAIKHFHHLADGKPWQGELLVTFRELLSRFMDVCDAMQFAHERHVLHRDLKPQNIMLGEYGETLVVDWGLAKPLFEGFDSDEVPSDAIVPISGSAIGSERDGNVLGTPQYMPPEQAAGKVNQLSCRSDIYSLGATLYHLLTNRPPFKVQEEDEEETSRRLTDSQARRSAVAKMLERVLAGQFDAPRKVCPQVPRGLSAICVRAMARKPDERYASARELKQEIQRWLADEPVMAVPEVWYDRVARWFRHHRTLTLVGGSSLAILCIIVTVSALLIGRYRLAKVQQERINELSTDLEEMVNQSTTSGAPLDASFFANQFDPKLSRLIPLSRDVAARRELSALEAAANSIQTRLTTTTPSQSQLAGLEQDIGQWSERVAARVDAGSTLSISEQDLLDLLNRRKAPWISLPTELSEATLVRALDAEEQLMVDSDGFVQNRSPEDSYRFQPFTLSQLPPNLNHEVVVRFRADSLGGPVVGVAVSPQTTRPEINQYTAVLCVEGFAAGQWSRLRRLPSLRDEIGQGRQVRMLLCRGRTPLSETHVSLPLQDFELGLQREENSLRARLVVGGTQVKLLEFQDFLSLPHANRPGLWIGPTTRIDAAELSYRALPAERSELEEIKALIATDNISEALQRLELRSDRYSQFLRTRCISQPGERLEQLKVLLQQSPQISQDGVVQDEWHLPALLDAIELNEKNPEQFRELVLKLVFFYGSSVDEIAVRVPQRLRDRLLSEFRKLGGRWRVANRPEGDVIQLDTAVSLDEILEPDPVMRRATRWRRCDVWRVADRVDEAQKELEKLLEESLADPAAEPGEAANLLSDLCWLLFARKRLPEAESLLSDLASRGNLGDDVQVAIEIESARLAVHQANLRRAADVLDEVLKTPDRMRRNQYADACLLGGFIALDLGDRDRAEELWQQGRTFQGTRHNLRNPNAAYLHGTQMVEHAAMITFDGTLGSMINGFSEDDAQAGFDALVPETSVFGSAGRAIVKTALDRALVRDLANALYRSPKGMQVARGMTYRTYTFREWFNEPITLMVFEGVVLKGFRDFRSDQELMADALSACRDLFLTYDAGGINEQEDMRLIVMLWNGESTIETWKTLEPKLSDEVAAGLALVAGRSQMLKAAEATDPQEKESHLRRARSMLQTARDHRGARGSFERLARKFLQEIGP